MSGDNNKSKGKKGETGKHSKKKEHKSKINKISVAVPPIMSTDIKASTNTTWQNGSTVPNDCFVQFDEHGKFTKAGLTGLSPRAQSQLYEAVLNTDRDFVLSLPVEIRKDLRDYVNESKREWLGDSDFAEQFIARVAIALKENLIAWWDPMMKTLNNNERAMWNEMNYYKAIDLAQDIIKCSQFSGAMYVYLVMLCINFGFDKLQIIFGICNLCVIVNT